MKIKKKDSSKVTFKDCIIYNKDREKSPEEDKITGRQACLHCNLFNVLISMVELNKIEEKEQ